MPSNRPLKVCFLTHNLAQDNGAGVFSQRLINGLKKEMGIEAVTFTIDGGKKLFLEIFKLRRAIKDCDVVHALDGYPYGVAAYLAAFGLDKKFIITAVGSGAIIYLYKWPFSVLLKRAYKRADKVIAISNFTKNEILKKIPSLKIEVINHGVDFTKWAAQTQSLEKSGVKMPYILSVGSLRWRKGYHRSIEAFKKISEVMPGLHYVIVGKKYADDYYERLKKLISELGLEKLVHILDDIDNQDDLIEIYKNAELFCLMPQTANRDVEGFGLVFLEAAAARLPVVGTNGSGTEDAVQDAKNGYLTEPRDVDGFAAAVIKILKNPNLKADMSRESLNLARNSGWEKKIAEYTALYGKITKTKIVYVTNARLPTEKAHGLATVKIAEAFVDIGYDMDLIAPRRRGETKPEVLQEHSQRDGARQAIFKKENPGFPANPAGKATPGDIFDFYQIRRNFKIKKLPTIDLFGFLPEKLAFLIQLFSFSKFATIYSIFKYNRATIFFSHDHAPLWFLSLFGRKIFYDIHHFPDGTFLYRRVLKKSFGLAVQTKWKIKALEEQFGVPPKKVIYWPNGTDVKKFEISDSREEARKKLNLPQDKKIALYTGQLFDWKGVDTFLLTAADLKNIDFYVVGGSTEDIKQLTKAQVLHDLAQSDGSSRAILQQENMRVHAKSGAEAIANIHFIGQRPHEEIPIWLRAADVLVLPNTGKQKVSLYYTSPMKMFEYMASGTPIVASDIPSIAEILNDKNAFLAGADDPKDFAEKINSIFSDSRELANRRAIEAKKDVQKYTWAERARKITEK